MSDVPRSDELKTLLSRGATESLDLELKGWIDPSNAHGKSKIAKACLALRNNDGGRLVIGFDDSGNQCTVDAPKDIRKQYSSDVLQEIISRFASEPFGIIVEYLDIENIEHPVIKVPGGVRSPVLCKSDLTGDDGKSLLRDNSLYVRSITSNYRVSSSEIRKGDWERLLSICFENREADVARFVRRHLVDIFDPQLLQATAMHGKNASVQNLLDRGCRRYAELLMQREVKLPQVLGYREFAVEVHGGEKTQVLNQSLLQRIASNAPRISGWGPWVVLLGSKTENDHPQVYQGMFEAFIDYLGGGFMAPHLDYWSINPRGEYYHIRALEDDLMFDVRGYEEITPGTYLDFLLQISRVAEGIAVAVSISQTLGFDLETAYLNFAARWQKLEGRRLYSWADRRRGISGGNAVQSEFAHTVKVPLNVAKGDIHQYVKPIIDNLFALFGGTEIDDRVVEGIVNEALDRK